KKRGLYDKVNIVVVSDHGMTATSNRRVVPIDTLVSGKQAIVRAWGGTTSIDALPGQQAAVARALVGTHTHFTCWPKAKVPPRLHYWSNKRVPDFICLAEEGWVLAPQSEIAKWKKDHPGGHGFDPMLPSMQALFAAHGPAFRRGSILPPIDNVDVYPLLAKIT